MGVYLLGISGVIIVTTTIVITLLQKQHSPTGLGLLDDGEKKKDPDFLSN